MPLRIKCPGCQTPQVIPDEMIGQKLRCKRCNKLFQVGSPRSSPPAAPREVSPAAIDSLPDLEPAGPPPGSLTTRPGFRPPVGPREPGTARGSEEKRRKPLRPPPREPGSRVLLWVGVVIAAFLLVGGVGLAVLLTRDTAEKQLAQTPPENRDAKLKPPGPPDGEKGKIDPMPVVQPQPADGGKPDVQPLPPPDRPAPIEPVRQPPVSPMKGQPLQLAQEQQEQRLPGAIADVAVGGAGRFLILHLPEQHQLAIFDAREARVVKYLPVGSEQIQFAAGLSKLIVVLPDQNLVQRWDLGTFERETILPLSVKGPIRSIALGSASAGPVLVCGGEAVFLDLVTLKPVSVTWDKKPQRGLSGDFLHASADGTVFGMRNRVGSEPHTVTTVVLTGHHALTYTASISGSLLLPGPDGRFIYTETGIYTPELKLVYPREFGKIVINPYLPAHHGSYFMHFEQDGGAGKGKLSVFVEGRSEPFAQIANVDGYIGRPIAYGKPPDKLMHDRRVHLIPEARLLVTIPQSNDRLVITRFDAEAVLSKSGTDYLLFTSHPSASVKKGVKWTYQLAARSSKGNVTYRLESGPEGMTLSTAGLLEWQPRAQKSGDGIVILRAQDTGGQECFQSFTLNRGS
jgi:hypothetical protein